MNRRLLLTAATALLLALAAVLYLLGFGGADRDWEAETEQGIALFEQEHYEEALATLQSIPIDESADWRVPYYIGSSHMMLKDYEAAAMALERSLAIKADEPGTLYALGVAYYRLGKLKLAKAYFSAVLEINPNDAHAKGLVDIMERLQQNTEAQAQQEESNGP